LRHFVVFLICIILITACISRREQSQQFATVATVNGVPIKEDDLRFRLNLEKNPFDDTKLTDLNFITELKHRVLNRMIENNLILEWGKQNGITLTQEEIDKGISRLKEGYTGREFELMLEERSIPSSKWQELAQENLFIDKVVDTFVSKKTTVTPHEVEVYYKDHSDEFKVGERVRVRHIVTDTLEKAQRLQEAVDKGENFAKVAIMHSLSPDRSSGGDLGYFERGTHPIEFDQTCFSMEIGQISPIVKSPYGFHLFKLIDKKPAGILAFEEVAARIQAELLKKKMAQNYQNWLEEVKSTATIDINEKALKKMEL
jgi:peptidyl-prolyl cis-trans isomerase C